MIDDETSGRLADSCSSSRVRRWIAQLPDECYCENRREGQDSPEQPEVHIASPSSDATPTVASLFTLTKLTARVPHEPVRTSAQCEDKRQTAEN